MMLTLAHGKKNIALLGAMCLFLAAVEYMIPKPLPFLRIGLANLPLLLALDVLSFRSFLALVSVKVLGQALITGTLFSYVFLFSMTGSFLSAVIMFLTRRALGRERVSFAGIGALGATVSNLSQLALAYVFVFGESVRYVAPPFLIAGLVTGVALGVFSEKIYSKNFNAEDAEEEEGAEFNEKRGCPQNRTSVVLFFVGVAVMPLIVFNPSTELRVVFFLVLWLLAVIFRKKTNPLITIAIIAIVVLFNLLVPYGYVLFSIGPFRITSGALRAGIHRAVTLQALFMLSKLTIRNDLKLPGAFGELLSESLKIFSSLRELKPSEVRRFSVSFVREFFKLNSEIFKNKDGVSPRK